MDINVKISLKNAIVKSLPILQPLTVQCIEPYQVWSRSRDQTWQGKYIDRTSLLKVFTESRKLLDVLGSEFTQLFKSRYPEYGAVVGFPGLLLMSILNDPSYILGNALSELWERYGTFECNEDAVDDIVHEFEEFVDLPTVRIRYMAQLLNYRMASQRIEFVDDMVIRQLSEAEVSEIYGGPIRSIGLRPNRAFGPHDYVLEGEYEERKIFNVDPTVGSEAFNQIRQNMDKVMLALRTFKEGQIGYENVRFKTVKFCPLSLPTLLGYGDLYMPIGQYYLSEEEVAALKHHASLIFTKLDPSMEMACSRLADAQNRLRAQDRLVDAVIGLEALLLAGLRMEDRRGELRYRFALHFSTLFPHPEERYRSFRVAKDLYDLRSEIAHGGKPKESDCRLGDEKVTLDEAARRACKLLRDVIARFLPYGSTAPYKQPQYWERSYFGLAPKI